MKECGFVSEVFREAGNSSLPLRQDSHEQTFLLWLKIIISIFAILIFSSCTRAADEFAKVRCGADIPKALTGRPESRKEIAITEAKYKSLGLRHLGASIIDNKTNTINWFICGREYVILDRSNVIADVIVFPSHSRTSPAFDGRCKINGRETNDSIIAILEGKFEPRKLLPARAAWRINIKNAKFIKIETKQMLCPSEGVYTVDGGM